MLNIAIAGFTAACGVLAMSEGWTVIAAINFGLAVSNFGFGVKSERNVNV